MTLPPPIAIYFAARDVAELLAAFSPDAVVEDEAQTHRGTDAIGAWWLAARAKYRHSARPLDLTEAGRETLVRATVTGDFPGSPATLRFAFAISGDRIQHLRIEA